MSRTLDWQYGNFLLSSTTDLAMLAADIQWEKVRLTIIVNFARHSMHSLPCSKTVFRFLLLRGAMTTLTWIARRS